MNYRFGSGVRVGGRRPRRGLHAANSGLSRCINGSQKAVIRRVVQGNDTHRHRKAGSLCRKRLLNIVEEDPNLKWASVVSVSDENVAGNLAALLEAEAVTTQVTGDSKLIGKALVWEIHVSVGMLERAGRCLEQSNFTDAELTYLETGLLSGDDDSR